MTGTSSGKKAAGHRPRLSIYRILNIQWSIHQWSIQWPDGFQWKWPGPVWSPEDSLPADLYISHIDTHIQMNSGSPLLLIAVSVILFIDPEIS